MILSLITKEIFEIKKSLEKIYMEIMFHLIQPIFKPAVRTHSISLLAFLILYHQRIQIVIQYQKKSILFLQKNMKHAVTVHKQLLHFFNGY